MTVETSVLWGWIGVLIILAVLGGIYYLIPHIREEINRERPITTCRINQEYGDKTAVDQLTLTIYKGEVFGLLGPNGAGKSTTILMMLGLSEPTSGSVRVRHRLHPSADSCQEKLGYLPDDVGFYEDRTGMENILYTAYLNRIPKPEAERRAKSSWKESASQTPPIKK